MVENMEIWNNLKRPPESALKKIKGGRLSGMTDVSPQWRWQALTEQFGVCGVGWKFEVERMWTESGSESQVFAFAHVLLYVKQNNTWSDPIPGIGGSMLVKKETAGLHSSDEGFKMAVTDALGTAAKCIGLAADIYMGKWDGSKYKDQQDPPPKTRVHPADQPSTGPKPITQPQVKKFYAMAKGASLSDAEAGELKDFLKNLESVDTFKDGDKTQITVSGAKYIFDNWDKLLSDWIEVSKDNEIPY